MAVSQEHLAGLCVLLQHVDVEAVVALPVAADPLGEAEALSCGLDRRLQHLPERHAPEPPEQPAPPVDGARHRHAVGPVERHRLQPARVVEGDRVRLRRPSGGVQAVQLVVLGRVVDRLHVAADAGALGLGQPQHRRSGDRGVGRVPALVEDLQPGLGGERLARRDDAMSRQHFRAGLLCPVPHPVAAHGGDARRRVGVRRGRRAERGGRDIARPTAGQRRGGRDRDPHGHSDRQPPHPPLHAFTHVHHAPPFLVRAAAAASGIRAARCPLPAPLNISLPGVAVCRRAGTQHRVLDLE